MNQINTGVDWSTMLMGEQLFFGLLGKILFTELDRDWLQTLIDEGVFAESPFGESQVEVKRGLELLQNWCQENRPEISDQAFKALRIDYTHLFVGVGKVLAPIWESVYFSKQRMIFQEETLLVRDWYRRYGLKSEKLHQEPDDHIGLELAFLAHLAQLGLQAIEQNNEAAFQQSLEAQRDFLSEHILKWAFTWGNLVQEYSKTDFYQGVAHLVCGALISAADFTGAKIPEEIDK